ncbi:TlpA family protein disulfide reductase [Tenacibaculum aiptasiae]|uniref:TlpA family protein disulfide reductase n=1 Tax=Tenacibaculum aiptasiae TaxID=426481 RepID=A0A7J5AQG1_9FLAO|nr:TlpA disulfide reductase family protein [Tenacibaculum aiptasiae]KAB1159654.1 TlpA family protein disulfide reductase [Tenacibaculum aiptasiae]
MKWKIKLALILLISSILFFLSYKISNKINYKKQIVENTKTIPTFTFENMVGDNYTDKDLLLKPVVFVYFNSDCDYCHSEATKIKERLNEFKNCQLIFISIEAKEKIKLFEDKYGFNVYKNIVFLEDRKGEFSKLFDVHSIPYIVVYDKNHKLLKKFKGITRIDDILKYLE